MNYQVNCPMDCQQAMSKIEEYCRAGIKKIDNQLCEKNLLEHLTDCPDCLNEAVKHFEIESIVSQAFTESKTNLEQASFEGATPLQFLRPRIEARADGKTSSATKPIGNSTMSTIFNQLKNRSRLTIGVALATVALLAVTVIPFKYDDTIGYEVAFAGVNKVLALDSDKISKLLNELGVKGATVDVSGCETTCNLKITDLQTAEDGRLLIAAFESVGAVHLTNGVTPIVDTIQGSLLSKASNFIFISGDDGEFGAEKLNSIIIERLGDNYETRIEACFKTISGDSIGVGINTLDGEDGGNFWVMDSSTGDAAMMFFGAISGDDLKGFDVGSGQLTDEQIARLRQEGYTVTVELGDDGSQQVLLHRGSDSLTIALNMLDDDGEHMWFVDSASGDSMLVFGGSVVDAQLNFRHLVMPGNDSSNCNLGDLSGFDFSDGQLTDEQIAELEAKGYSVTITQTDDGKQQIVLQKSSTSGDGSIHEEKEVVDFIGNDDALAKETPDSLGDPSALPEGFALSQNYPNPFNPNTKIDYTLASTERVHIDILNVMGQTVRTLVDEQVGPGAHTVEWDATDDNGRQVASGMYFYRFKAGKAVQTRKMTLLK